ncbi:MAG: helix-turn-helix domain-containing protein [Thermoleophilaceae bacterium]
MPPIGDTLREARMRQRLDVADVEERTKIRAKYLRALENEEWGLLPGPTFVRTFLRTYAEAVGLDPHVLVEEYRAEHDEEEDSEPQPQPLASSRGLPRVGAPRPGRGRPRAPGPPGPIVLLGGVVAVILVFLVVLGLVGGDDGSSDKPKGATTRTAPRKAAKPKKPPRPAVRGVTLRIAPTVPTYVCVDSGEGSDRVFEGTLEQPRTFKNATELRANLGKRSVKITANGKGLPVESNASPLGLRVTRMGAREITSGARPCA